MRLDFSAEPKVPTDEEYGKLAPSDREVPLKLLKDRHAKWKEWVSTPAILAKAGVRFAFATDGLSKPETFGPQLRRVV